ncbi:hypothetical protein OG920_41005 [Streptomyces europaeiscabiei]
MNWMTAAEADRLVEVAEAERPDGLAAHEPRDGVGGVLGGGQAAPAGAVDLAPGQTNGGGVADGVDLRVGNRTQGGVDQDEAAVVGGDPGVGGER